MNKEISNNLRRTQYFDLKRNSFVTEVDREFLARLSKVDSSQQYVAEALSFDSKTIRAGICGLFAVPGKTRWNISKDAMTLSGLIGDDATKQSTLPPSIEHLTRGYIRAARGSTIAVELSGGLDTAILIGVLANHSTTPVTLVGIASKRFEFRTERAVQEYYANKYINTSLIAQESVLPFEGLSEIPIHVYPDSAALYFHRHFMLATAAKKLGATVILNGNAGDTLFCHGRNKIGTVIDVLAYEGWGISEDWLNRYCYSKLGLRYISAYSLKNVSRLLLGLRANELEDPLKLWARRHFSMYLPPQLSAFAYKATHDAWLVEGLNTSFDEIATVFSTAYAFARNDNFSKYSLVKTVSNISTIPDCDKQAFLARLAYATWIHAYVREGYL